MISDTLQFPSCVGLIVLPAACVVDFHQNNCKWGFDALNQRTKLMIQMTDQDAPNKVADARLNRRGADFGFSLFLLHA